MALVDLQFCVHVPVAGGRYRGVQQGAEEFYGYGVVLEIQGINILVFER